MPPDPLDWPLVLAPPVIFIFLHPYVTAPLKLCVCNIRKYTFFGHQPLGRPWRIMQNASIMLCRNSLKMALLCFGLILFCSISVSVMLGAHACKITCSSHDGMDNGCRGQRGAGGHKRVRVRGSCCWLFKPVN